MYSISPETGYYENTLLVHTHIQYRTQTEISLTTETEKHLGTAHIFTMFVLKNRYIWSLKKRNQLIHMQYTR
jgi:sugar phosphate permease